MWGMTSSVSRLAGDPLRGDLIRRFAPPVRLAVPEKPFGLTLFLRFFDRCGNCVLAFSATCSARPQFPVRGEGFWREGEDVGLYVSTAKRAEATTPPTSGGLLRAGCRLPLRRGGLGGWVIASSPTTAFEQTTPHPSSASRGIGGCHLPLKGKAFGGPSRTPAPTIGSYIPGPRRRGCSGARRGRSPASPGDGECERPRCSRRRRAPRSRPCDRDPGGGRPGRGFA